MSAGQGRQTWSDGVLDLPQLGVDGTHSGKPVVEGIRFVRGETIIRGCHEALLCLDVRLFLVVGELPPLLPHSDSVAGERITLLGRGAPSGDELLESGDGVTGSGTECGVVQEGEERVGDVDLEVARSARRRLRERCREGRKSKGTEGRSEQKIGRYHLGDTRSA